MGDSATVKIGLSAAVIILMVPGVIVEPGPVSEIGGLAALGTIWGFDFDD